MLTMKAHIIRGAIEGVWVQGGGIALPCKYFVYGLKKIQSVSEE